MSKSEARSGTLVLTKHSIIYGIPGVISNAVSFLLLPTYTRFLSPSDYGVLSLLGVTWVIAEMILTLGLPAAAFREVIYSETDKKVAFSTGFWTMLISISSGAIIFILFASKFSEWILGDLEWTLLFRIFILSSVIKSLGTWTLVRCRIEQKPIPFALLSTASTLLNTATGITAVAILKLGIKGFIVAGLICSVMMSLPYLLLLRDLLGATIATRPLKSMLKFSVPLVPGTLSVWVLTSADHYFLKHFGTLTDVGLYSVGYKFGAIMSLAVQAFQIAWPAELFRIAKEPNASHRFGRILTYYSFMMGFIALTLSVFGREVLRLMASPNFWPAYKVIPLITLSYLLYGIRHMTRIGIWVYSKTYIDSILLAIAAALNTVLNLLLIPPYGMMGAAWATLLSYTLVLIMAAVINQRLFPIKYEWSRISAIGFIWCLVFGLSKLTETNSNVWVVIGMKSFLLGLYGIPFMVPSLFGAERDRIREILSSKVPIIRRVLG